ncbi:MAG: amidohydrolase [Sediminibacterium sp.]
MSSLSFSLIQTQLYWEDKAANLAMLHEKIMGIQAGTEIVVLPEMFSTGFSMQPEKSAETMDGETVNWMKHTAAAKKVILTGSLIIEEQGCFYNRLLWVLPDGTLGHYDKRHLFAFAGEADHYTAGGRRLIAQVKGWKVNLQVCYDLRFPVWARQQPGAVPEYDVLLCVANWPERRSHAWKTLLAARAIENQCYVIGLNRVGNDGNHIYHSGDSMVLDGLGTVLYHKTHDEDIHTITLEKEPLEEIRTRFPFWRDADHFNILSS